MEKFKKALAKIGAAVRWLGKQLWSVLADGQWDFDPYKLGAFACYAFAANLALRVFGIVDAWIAAGQSVDAAALASLVGLPALIGGFGTVLLSTASKVDRSMLGPGPGKP